MDVRAGFSRFGLAIRRFPFTLGMIVILLVVAWGTNSYFQELAREWVSRLGFAPRDFWFLRWGRLVVSALVTSGESIFWLALAMVTFSSGIVEWRAGSLRAGSTFWGVHLVTLVCESLLVLLPLHRLGFPQARVVFFSRYVGPSAGYMGSLGLAVTFIPKSFRSVVLGLVLAYLVVALFLPSRAGVPPAIELSDDLAHLIAFPLGWMSVYLFKITRRIFARREHVR